MIKHEFFIIRFYVLFSIWTRIELHQNLIVRIYNNHLRIIIIRHQDALIQVIL